MKPIAQVNPLLQINWFITGRNEVVAKVMFLHVSVILFTGGVLGSPPDRENPQGPGRHPHQTRQTPPPDQADPPNRENPSPQDQAVRSRVFYSYFRMSTEHRSLLIVYAFNFYQTLRVVPHGTKGTGPGFVTRPVYLRSQFRNNTNTVSTLVLLIHLLQVLCTRYAGNAHHRALQTSGQGWADSKAVHGMECSGARTLCRRSLSAGAAA